MSSEIGVRVTGDNRPYKQVLEDSKRATQGFVDSTDRQLTKAEKAYEDLGRKIGDSIRKGVERGGTILTIGVTLPLLAAARAATNAASDLEESTNRISVTFGDAAKRIEDFGRTSDKAFALSKQGAYDAASTFGGILRETKLSQAALAEMSITLTKLSGDLAAFKSIKPEEALEKLRSALTGEYGPLKNIGYGLNDVAVAAKAAELGFKGKTKELTEAQKMLVRYILVLEKTRDAQGHVARTSDLVSTQSRILQEEIKNLSASIGQDLLPIKRDLLKTGRDLVAMLQKLSPEQREQILKWAAIAAAAGPALKALTGLLAVTRAIIAVRTAYVEAQAAMAAANAATAASAGEATIAVSGLRAALMTAGGVAGIVVGGSIAGTGLMLKSLYDMKVESTRRFNERVDSPGYGDAGYKMWLDQLKSQPGKNENDRVKSLQSWAKGTNYPIEYNGMNLAEFLDQYGRLGLAQGRMGAPKAAPGKSIEELIAEALRKAGGMTGDIAKGGSGGRVSRSRADEGNRSLNPFSVDDTLKERMEAAQKLAEEIGRWFIGIRQRLFEGGGDRSNVERFDWLRKNDPSSVEARMGKLTAGAARAQAGALDEQAVRAELDKQLENRQKQIDAMRDQARESGVLAGVEQMLVSLEQKKGSAFFTFKAAQVASRIKELGIEKDANEKADAQILRLREQAGLAKEMTFEAQARLTIEKELAAASQSRKDELVDLGKMLDAQAAARAAFAEASIITDADQEKTRRYSDTLRDLALKLETLGATSESTRLKIQLLQEGMSPEQAGVIVNMQKRIEELQQYRDLATRAADQMANSILESFQQIRNGGSALFRGLLDGFRTTLAEMAAEFLRSWIRQQLTNLLGSLFKAGAGAAGAGGSIIGMGGGGNGGFGDSGFGGGSGGFGSGGNGGFGSSGLGGARPTAPSVIVNMPISSPDVGGFRKHQDQIMQQGLAAALVALRRNG